MANSKDPDDDDKDAVDTIALVREAFFGLLVFFFLVTPAKVLATVRPTVIAMINTMIQCFSSPLLLATLRCSMWRKKGCLRASQLVKRAEVQMVLTVDVAHDIILEVKQERADIAQPPSPNIREDIIVGGVLLIAPSCLLHTSTRMYPTVILYSLSPVSAGQGCAA